MPDEVRLWRPSETSGLLCMHGVTSGYSLDPVGEWVIGVVLRGAMEVRRGRERHVVRAGEVCVWDPSQRHEGRPLDGHAWEGRLIVIEPGEHDALASPRAFRLRDRIVAARFVALHRSLETSATRLERDDALIAWLGVLAPPDEDRARTASARRDPGLRRASEWLRDDPTAGVSLDELAAVAGTSRHRLSRLFRTAYGVAPHRFQIAQRLRLARTLLEQGVSIGKVAQMTGFADQSHLHRHFRRAIGFTPARYAAQLRSNVQYGRRGPR